MAGGSSVCSSLSTGVVVQFELPVIMAPIAQRDVMANRHHNACHAPVTKRFINHWSEIARRDKCSTNAEAIRAAIRLAA
jgi:hypothetical protein